MFEAVSHIVFGVVPWEVWGGVMVAATLTALFLVPPPLKGWVTMAVVALAVSVGAYAKGRNEERDYWRAQVLAERARLAKEMEQATALERDLRAATEAAILDMQRERDDAIEKAKLGAGAGDVVIPEPLARRVCNIAGGCADSGPTGGSRGAKAPKRLRASPPR